MTPRAEFPRTTHTTPEASLPAAGACATPMAVVGRAHDLRATNPALREWLGAGARNWLGEHLAVLDAKPPQVCDAVARAFVQEVVRGNRRLVNRAPAARLRPFTI